MHGRNDLKVVSRRRRRRGPLQRPGVPGVIAGHLAERTLGRGDQGGFLRLWAATIALGVLFLLGTAYEWYGLISRGLTIGRNLFGSTYYTLVGAHALHVTGGVTIMLIVLGLALRRQVTTANRAGVGLVSWYWHFVDAVWVVVFTVVYLLGR